MRRAAVVALALLAAGVAAAQEAPPAGPQPEPDEPVQEASQEAAQKGLEHEIIEWEEQPQGRSGTLRFPGLIPGRRWTVDWRDGLKITSHAGLFAFQFGGRVLADGGFFHLGGGLDDVLGPGAGGWDADGRVREARIYGQGVFLDRFFAKADVDVDAGIMRDVYWGVRNLGPLGTLQVGFMKEPFSLEEKNSTLAIPTLERSLANLFAPKRGTGFLLTNTHFERRLRWEAGTFFVVDSFAEANENEGFDGAYDVALRVTGLPLWHEGEHEEEMLLVGVSYAHRFNISDDVRFATRPESSLAPVLFDTGPIPGAESLDRGGLETAWSDGRRTVQAEVIYTTLHRRNAPDLSFWGAYLQASLLLSDDVRRYGRRAGAFGRIVPRRPLDPRKGQWGALEVVGRVSALDLDDGSVRGGRALDATLGLSWFPWTKVRLSANYVLAWRLGEGFANVFETRLSLDY